MGRLDYYRRIFAAYLTPARSQLTFWHETPEMNADFEPGNLGPYYMLFREKADYPGPFDDHGVPLLDYRGRIGRQHNPIAIAQYGLANYNLFRRERDEDRRRRFLVAADWLLGHLEQNRAGVFVWNHHFDWEYRTPLIAPWYSGLAQGQGISLLLRAHSATGQTRYLDAARRAFEAFRRPVNQGGVVSGDKSGNIWFEEYVVTPPTHILNGFLWATWGVYDFLLATGEGEARSLFESAVQAIEAGLARYDCGYWSLYEQSGTRLKMLASPFYHRLHVTQLRVMQRLTGKPVFAEYANRWEAYARSRGNRTRALLYKSLFKLIYY